MKWPWIIGLCIVVPIILYLFGYFWTRGSLSAKSEYLNKIFNNEGKTPQKTKGEKL